MHSFTVLVTGVAPDNIPKIVKRSADSLDPIHFVNYSPDLDLHMCDRPIILLVHDVRREDIERIVKECKEKIVWVHSLYAGVDGLVNRIGELSPKIPLTNAKGVYSSSLAEYCIGAMLYFAKKFKQLEDNKRSKTWDKFTMGVLKGKVVGFLGYGDIAQTCATLCRAFGMRVLALKRTRSGFSNIVSIESPDQVYLTSDFKGVSEFLSASDYVVCTLPGTPSTYHFYDAKLFSGMKPSSVFVSLGRGNCVDEIALADALSTGQISGAALDVFQTEPLPRDSSLWSLDNCLISSHNADWVGDNFETSFELFLGNVEKWLKGNCTMPVMIPLGSFNVETLANQAVESMPAAPSALLSGNMCDSVFRIPMQVAHYVFKTGVPPVDSKLNNYDFSVKIGGPIDHETLRYGCSNYTHVASTPSGLVNVQAGDVGNPDTLVIRQGSGAIPPEIFVKRMAPGSVDSEWRQFIPSTGNFNTQGNLEIGVTPQHPSANNVINNSQNELNRIALTDKMYGIEYAASTLANML